METLEDWCMLSLGDKCCQRYDRCTQAFVDYIFRNERGFNLQPKINSADTQYLKYGDIRYAIWSKDLLFRQRDDIFAHFGSALWLILIQRRSAESNPKHQQTIQMKEFCKNMQKEQIVLTVYTIK